MAKRQAKSKRQKSKIKSIQLKRRSRKSSRVSRSHSKYGGIQSDVNNLLDGSVSVRSLLKYTSITLAFLLILTSVFMLGRVSAVDEETIGSSENSMQLSGETKQIEKESSDSDQSDSEEIEEEEPEDIVEIEVANLSEIEEEKTSSYQEVVYTVADEDDVIVEDEVIETSSCKSKIAGFDYSYTLVSVEVSNFNKELKGDNWGSITSLKLTVTNNEPCTIINPTKIKIKLNPRGKGSVWWDEDAFLSDSFKHMLPGATVTEILPVHITYSDIYGEKEFKLTMVDDYDIPISTVKEYLKLH